MGGGIGREAVLGGTTVFHKTSFSKLHRRFFSLYFNLRFSTSNLAALYEHSASLHILHRKSDNWTTPNLSISLNNPPPLSHPTSYQTGRPVFTSALHRPLTLLQGMGHQNEHGGQCFEEPQQKEICEYFATIFFLSSLEWPSMIDTCTRQNYLPRFFAIKWLTNLTTC